MKKPDETTTLEGVGSTVVLELRSNDSWESVALRLGEMLAETGPDGYYSMSPALWFKWGSQVISDIARIAAKQEREACAKLCEEDFERYSNTVNTNGGYWYGKRDWDECARDIRMRSNDQAKGPASAGPA